MVVVRKAAHAEIGCGALVGSLVRKTAVPGTRTGGFFSSVVTI